MNKAIQEVSAETLKIENLLRSATPGERLTYKLIEELTGVKMDAKGKGYLRTAFNRLKLEYMVIKGQGVEVLSSSNAMNIVANGVSRIDSAVRRAEKKTTNVRNKVYNELDPIAQNNINVLSALFGSIRQFAKSGKQLFSKPTPKVGEIAGPYQPSQLK